MRTGISQEWGGCEIFLLGKAALRWVTLQKDASDWIHSVNGGAASSFFVRRTKISFAKVASLDNLSGSMAKTSWLERNKRKQETVNKYAKLRKELKAAGDYVGLSMLPRDASPTRLVNRCRVSGRRRAYLRRFAMSRLTFREHALQGLIPGVTKSSW